MKWKSITKFVLSGLQFEEVFGRRLAYATPFIAAMALASGAVVIRNIARRKRAEEESERLRERLVSSDRQANLGKLALGITHEVNNLMMGLRGSAQIAQLPGKEERLKEFPGVIIKLADRAQNIAENLQGFSERPRPASEMVRPAETVMSIIRLMKPGLEKDQIKVEIDIPEDASVMADGGKLQQVLLNLIVNAQHAMPEGGTLSIKIEEKDDGFQLQVSDTGTGIPEHVLPRIFEPFFTTKGPLGTGLGLSISCDIMRSLGGSIEAESWEGRGSTFTLNLPEGSDEKRAPM